jgi:aldehyde dehydrogenase (NAD+)/betaine-aldehyde dehydrogenase
MSTNETFQLYIDGAFCPAEGGTTFESVEPATGQTWARMPAASAADVDRAVAAAKRALDEGPWPEMTASARGRLLWRLGDLLAARAGEFATLETRDTGKVIRETGGQATYVAQFYHYFAGLADKLEGHTLPIDKPDMMVMTLREPIGVVAAVVPWNSQLFLTAVKLGPALAAGNTVVLKAAETGPAPLLKFAELIDEAGFPPGVVNIVTGFGEPCGRRLTSHPDVARVAFTGGPETARHVVRNTAENFAHLSLELGGKSPFIVFADADLDSAANGVVAGIFGASGQSCVAGSRLFLEAPVYDEMVARLTTKAAAIKIGDPLDPATEMGPLCTAAQVERIERTLAASLGSGAELLCGGNRPQAFPEGFYFEPTMVACDAPEVAVAETELFGPVLSVFRFEGEKEVVRLANATRYGLAAGAFTRDIGRALRVAKGIRAGIAWINTYRAVSPVAPFGGYKDSGLGRECGPESILDYTRVKTVWINTSSEPMADPFVMR